MKLPSHISHNNEGSEFNPPLNPAITNVAIPPTGLIVRKNSNGQWLDDNEGDWTEFISGSQADVTERIQGWDLPDRDLALLQACA